MGKFASELDAEQRDKVTWSESYFLYISCRRLDVGSIIYLVKRWHHVIGKKASWYKGSMMLWEIFCWETMDPAIMCM